jgi:hypothetical protein
MRKGRAGLLSVFAALAALSLPVHAETYLATFTSGRLKPVRGSNIPGIPGVKHWTLTLYSSTPFPAYFCCSWTGKYTFSDGVDTLKSLTSEGFTVQAGYPYVNYSTDGSGNITSWYARTNMPNPTTNTYYSWFVYANFEGDNDAGVVFQALPGGETTEQDEGLPASAVFLTKP